MTNDGPIRVLVADDSYFIRSLIRAILDKEPDMQIVGEAKDGLEAVAMASRLKPNVVTMDFNMPELNGEQAVSRIFENSDQPPAIVMFSAVTKEGAEETLRCLQAGVVDFLAKPSGEVSINLDSIQEALVEKIRIASRAKVRRHIHPAARKVIEKKYHHFHPNVIVMGSSTGGPPMVEYILTNLSALSVPFLIVQHMPKKFTAFFAERLDKIVSFPVKEAQEGDVLQAGHCYVAPGDWHMELRDTGGGKRIHLTQSEPFLGLRPAINRTMVSARDIYGDSVLGIVLTGMGNDGTEGIEMIKNAGGVALVQEPETAVVDSMPASVIKRGLADEILTPQEIVERLNEFNN